MAQALWRYLGTRLVFASLLPQRLGHPRRGSDRPFLEPIAEPSAREPRVVLALVLDHLVPPPERFDRVARDLVADASEDAESPNKNMSYLAVAKITATEICVTDKISPGPKANEDARRAADAASTKPCLKDHN